MAQQSYEKNEKSTIQQEMGSPPLPGRENRSLARKRNSMDIPPSFRIVLVGHDWVQKNKVANVLLERDGLFEPESASSPAKNYNTGVTEYVKDRYMTIVNTAELFTPDLSDDVLKQRVKECVYFCAPGPHALVLVVNRADFDEPERKRMEYIVNSFSEHACRHSIVFIYKDYDQENKEIENIITFCGGRKHQYRITIQTDALKAIEEMVSGNGWSFVNYDMFEDAEESTEVCTNDPSRQEDGDRGTLNVISSSSNVVSTGHISSERLNLVLWGSNAAAKASAADLILGLGEQTEPSPQPSSACVKREAEVCGRHVVLVLLPSLGDTQLSEEALLEEIPQCLRLCDPGVHAFILVTPQGPLTDEYKVELKRFEHFFGKEVDAYCERVLTSESEESAQDGGQGAVAQDGNERGYHILDHSSKVLPLLERVEKMRQKNAGCYTSDMYISGQLEIHLQCHSRLQEMKMTIQSLQSEISNLKGSNQDDTDNIRIVLLGKTGRGKSATGNTILGHKEFREDASMKSVTKVCMKKTAMINGRQITVVDTPGLFDTACDHERTMKEIIRCIAMAAPGPHVFLLVVSVGRFTQEERDAVKMIQAKFGEESGKYTVVLFTRGDDLQGKTLDEYLEGTDAGIMSFLGNCGNRHHLFNNRQESSSDQVPKLLDKIDAMLRANGGKYYTTEMFQKAEEALKQEQERILKEREEEIKKEKEVLQAKHEDEMEKLKREMEKQRKKQEEERIQKEEEIKCKEQVLKQAINNLEEEQRRKRLEMEEEYQKKQKQNEDWINQRTNEVQLERQRQLEEWERKTQAEKKRREEEAKQRKSKEKADEEERQQKQRQEKEKFDRKMEEILNREKEELIKRRQENEERVKKEEERRIDLEETIKHAEESRVKDLEEQKRKHDEECKKKREEEEKRRQEEERKWKEQIQSMQKERSTNQERQRQERERYEREQQEEKKRRDAEEKQRKQEQEDERKDAQRQIKEKEDEMRELQQDYELQLQEEERKIREIEEQQREEMVQQLRKQREQFEEEKQKEAEASKDKERRNIEYLAELHGKEKDDLKRETEMAARMQAEQEFNEELDRRVEEAKTQGHCEGHEEGKEEGLKKGKEEGLKKGKEEGLKKGKEEGLKKGKEEGLKKGKEEGLKKGKEEGLKKGKEEGFKEGRDKGMEEVESQRTALGRGLDDVIHYIRRVKKPIPK